MRAVVRNRPNPANKYRRIILLLLFIMLAIYIGGSTYFSYQFTQKILNNNNGNNNNDSANKLVDEKNKPPSSATVREEKKATIDPNEDIHIVFSTGCNYFQHWQAEVLLHSHMKVGQKGKITRVVSGCDTEHIKRKHAMYLTHPEGLGDLPVPLEELKMSSNPNFELYVTPSFDDAREFPWINKPLGLAHWLENAKPKESVIVIIDPDMMFLAPITQDGTRTVGNGGALCSTGCVNVPEFQDPNLSDKVKKGRPVSQQYGLGGSWVYKYNVTSVVGPDSKAVKLTSREASKFYAVGPPMMVHNEDLQKIMPLWVKLMYPVWKTDPGDIQADMYAYSYACAHLGLPHLMMDHFMVSSPNTQGEAWPLLPTSVKYPCSDPSKNLKFKPTFFHMAQRYDSQTPFMLHKGHVPPNILNCDLPLIIKAPEDVIDEVVGTSKSQFHKNYMMCVAHSEINQAALSWKKKFCPNGFNSEHEIMLQKQSQSCKKDTYGKICWDFATWDKKMIEGGHHIRIKK